MKKMLLIFLSFLSSFNLISQQSVDVAWYQTHRHPDSYSEKVHDMIWLRDGNLALVGEIKNSSDGKDGLFMIIDGNSGQEIERKVIPGIGDNVLNALVYGDYSFFAVGYKDNGKRQKRDGWLVELEWNDEITILQDTTIGTTSNDEFIDLIWTKNSTALIAGQTDEEKGNIWMVNWDGKKVLNRNVLGGEFYKSIVGMEKGRNGNAWLCGNTRKSKSRNINDYNLWWLEVDATGKYVNHKTIGNDNVKLFAANRSLRGDMLMTGENWKHGKADAWLLERDNNNADVHDVVYNKIDPEIITAIYKSPKGKYWTTIRYRKEDFNRNEPGTKLVIWSDVGMDAPIFEDELTFLDGHHFEAVRIVRTAENHYVLAGNVAETKGAPSKIHVRCFRDSDFMVSKGLNKKLENTPPVLRTRENTSILIPNQRGALKFEIKNTGDEDILDGNIVVETIKLMSGVTVLNKSEYFSYLPVGLSESYGIELQTAGEVEEGESEFLVKIMNNDLVIHRFTAKVRSGKMSAKTISGSTTNGINDNVQFRWTEPNIRATGTVKQVVENSGKIKIDIDSREKIELGDVIITRNEMELIDNKGINGLLSEPFVIKNIYKYSFEYDLTDKLEEGPNEIMVSVKNGEPSIPITIIYKPQQPNLHVLAIGPTYKDLKYPAKDAMDFATTLQNMQENLADEEKLFGEIYVKTLTEKYETNKTDIEIETKDFAQRDIKPNDFVIFYYSGHGIERKGSFKLCPSNYRPGENENYTTINYEEKILNPLSKMKGKVFVFLDACQSAMAKNDFSPGEVGKAMMEANRLQPGMMTITSCKEHQYSYEVQADEMWQNGVFTRALIEAIRGMEVKISDNELTTADMGYTDDNGVEQDKANNGIVTAGELIPFLQKRVSYLVKLQGNDEQNPSVPVEGINRKVPLFIHGKK